MPFSGTVSSQASLHRSVSGALGTLTGTVNKKISVSVSGVLGTLSGSLSWSIGTIYESVAGVLGTFAGTVSRKYLGKRTVQGQLNMTGDVSRKASLKRTVAGVLSFSGSAMDNLLETFQIAVSGVMGTITGTVSKAYYTGGKIISKGLSLLGTDMSLK